MQAFASAQGQQAFSQALSTATASNPANAGNAIATSFAVASATGNTGAATTAVANRQRCCHLLPPGRLPARPPARHSLDLGSHSGYWRLLFVV